MVEPVSKERTPRRSALTTTLLCLLYYAAARFGLSLAVVNPSISAVWPPSAVGFVAMLVLGRSAWPGVFAGAFLINLQVNLSRPHPAIGVCVLAAAGIAAGNTLEALLASWATTRWAAGARWLERADDVLKMSVLAGLLSPLAAATGGVLCLRAAGMLPREDFASAWTTWWLGDCAGILIVSPLLLLWLVPPTRRSDGGGLPEAGALGLLFAAVAGLVFFRSSLPISFLVLPVLIWTAFRFGIRGTAVMVCLLSLAALAGTVNGRGPFAVGHGPDLMLLQCFMGTIAVSAFVMAALVSERERAEEALRLSHGRLEAEVDRRTLELVHAQKMEAVGRLAGGVAHEFNNVLTGIVGLAELIRDEVEGNAQAAEDAGTIITASRRGAELVGRLLAFARRRDVERKPLDLNAAVAGSAKMIRMALGEGIEFRLQLDPDIPAVLAARDNLEQILLNLCLNSRDAMAGSGSITVSTRRERVEEPRLLSHGAAAPGTYAVLSLTDTGAGIPEDIRSMIFEPFFSTKKSGQGTGLGLSIVYRIVTDHKGAVDLDSRPGRTEFRIYLPATSGAPAPVTPPSEQAPPRGGTETLLIADDDELVRSVLVRSLEPLGYTLLVAKDGEEAWRLYSQNAERVSLALFDIVMPKLGGDLVYARIVEQNPKFKVLFMSGHATAPAEETIANRRLPFISKPFPIDRIVVMVRELLDRE